MMNKKQLALVYLTGKRFYFYKDSLDKILSFEIKNDTVKDIEIINPANLEAAISSLFNTNKILPCRIVLVIGEDLYLEKDFPVNNTFEHDDIQRFIDNIPFENYLHKPYKADGGNKVIVINKDYYETVKGFIEKYKFIVEMVFPVYLFGVKIKPDNALDIPTAKFMIEKSLSFRQENMMPKWQNTGIGQLSEDEKMKKQKTTIIAVAIFAMGMFLLAITAFFTLIPGKPAAVKKLATAEVIGNPFPSKKPETDLKSGKQEAALKPEQYKVEVLNGTGISGQARLVQEKLSGIGFKNIEIGTTTNVNKGKPILFFSSKLTQDEKTGLTEMIAGVLGEVKTEDTAETNFDLILITGSVQTD